LIVLYSLEKWHRFVLPIEVVIYPKVMIKVFLMNIRSSSLDILFGENNNQIFLFFFYFERKRRVARHKYDKW